MKIPWWLHRVLIIGLTGIGFLAGAYNGLHLMSYFSRLPGTRIPHVLLMALLPLGAILGTVIPQLIFRKWIHATCPQDGERMVLERVTIQPHGDHRRVGKMASQYRCKRCGCTK